MVNDYKKQYLSNCIDKKKGKQEMEYWNDKAIIDYIEDDYLLGNMSIEFINYGKHLYGGKSLIRLEFYNYEKRKK